MDSNEKYIVDSLKNHQEEIDLDGLWADVVPQIPREKKKRKMGFWIFGSMAVALMLIGVVWVKNTNVDFGENKPSTVEKLNVDQKIDVVHDAEIQSNIQLTTELSTLNHGENANSSALIDKNKKSNAQKIDIENRSNNVASESKNTLNSKSDYSNSRETKEINNSTFPSTLNSTNLDSHAENDKTEVAWNNLENTTNSGRATLFQLPLLKNNQSLLSTRKKRAFDQMNFTIPNIDQSLIASNRWNIYLLGGGALVSRSLNSRSNELNNELTRRETVVDVLGAWEIEAGMGFRLSPKLKIMTGLNYTQIHEKATFETDYLVDYEVQTNNVINKQDGSVENKIGSTPGQGIRHTEEIRFNQLRMIQIPVRLSYNVINIDKYKINVGALASYTVKQRYEGFSSFSASQESYDLQSDEENKFRSSGSMSYGIFLEGATHLTKMLDLSFSIGYKQTGKINSEIYLIDQQYNSLTFSSGISRRF